MRRLGERRAVLKTMGERRTEFERIRERRAVLESIGERKYEYLIEEGD